VSYDGRPHIQRDRRSWIGPAAALIAISLGVGINVYFVADGQEIADDARYLLALVESPLVLWGDYRASGFSDLFGSFPPLLPLVFGLLVLPWTAIVPGFWAIRLGILCWSLVALAVLHHQLGRDGASSPGRRRSALWAYAVLPSVWGAVALIPQEEIYVAIYVLLLYAAARAERWSWVLGLLVLTALGGKYFLLILSIPLAFASRAPLRNLFLFAGASAATIVLYVGYHLLAHGLSPILSHNVDPSAAVSLSGLLWNLGIQPPGQLLRLLCVGSCIVAAVGFGVVARGSRIPLCFSLAITLWITLLGLPITFPGYALWSIPLTLICVSRLEAPFPRRGILALLVSFGAAEWGANFARGVSQSLTAPAGGKSALATQAVEILGRDFPFSTIHIACLLGVLASGAGLIALLWAGARSSEELHG
jgi:hypothetical protein